MDDERVHGRLGLVGYVALFLREHDEERRGHLGLVGYVALFLQEHDEVVRGRRDHDYGYGPFRVIRSSRLALRLPGRAVGRQCNGWES